ncbi:hypothetical protein [Thalassolituus alkanivorans]|uniref:hypothetical protein n=1 Tax=Thalassolituus alkanivorans TaxID=2881055 RepID=UPI001E582D48|nr:hypothetical protein [Thalassolituus alkanivorans]MCB2385833.1 hypothetical protein [Thalassolituus alkanivorans]MCB2421683.1 hypothetical protein [Thalassolituus alkanivorans]
MQDIDTTSTQSLVDRYYEEEKAKREREQTLAAFTMRMDANDLAMLNVIARRFRKNRDEIAQEVLSNALIDLFARLDAGERKLLARDADEAARSLADEIAEENGIHSVEIKTGVWANHDRQITKIERKKAKMQESGNRPQSNSADNDDADTDDEAAAQTGNQTDNQPMTAQNDSAPAAAMTTEPENTDQSTEETTEHKEESQPMSMFGS